MLKLFYSGLILLYVIYGDFRGCSLWCTRSSWTYIKQAVPSTSSLHNFLKYRLKNSNKK